MGCAGAVGIGEEVPAARAELGDGDGTGVVTTVFLGLPVEETSGEDTGESWVIGTDGDDADPPCVGKIRAGGGA